MKEYHLKIWKLCSTCIENNKRALEMKQPFIVITLDENECEWYKLIEIMSDA